MWWFIVILVIIVLVGFMIYQQKRTDKPQKKENPVYVCTECGEHHCNCHQEEK